MSDSVRSLVVSLYLDSGKFDKAIRLVNKEIRQAESEFKLAGAGVKDFEKTLKGVDAKAEMLRKTLKGQTENVSALTGKLNTLNKRQQEQYTEYERISAQYREAKADLLQYKNAVEKTQKALRLAEQGGDPLLIEALNDKLADQTQLYKEQEKEVEKLASGVDKYAEKLGSTQYAITNTTAALNEQKAAMKETGDELNKNENAWYKYGVAMQNWADKARGASEAVSQFGGKLTKTITTPILAAGAAAAKAGIDYEDAFAGVRKTVSVTSGDAEAFFAKLSDSVIDMSKRLATGAADISEVMAIAGQLGIENDELESFTETIVRLGMSTNLAGEEAASAMAKFANITGMAQSKFSNMGATLVDLGNNFATTEADVMEMAVRIGAAGKQVGLTEPQILGFSAALSSLGLESEAGGSAFSKALRKMETAVATGSSALGDFARVAGMTSEQFAQMWKNNPAEAFQAFIVGLGSMNDEGIGAIATLDEIGITELRLSDTLLRSANATDLISDALARANVAWEENTALMTESDTRLQTTASKLTNIKNSLIAVGIEFADTMAPEIETVVKGLGDAVKWFGSLDDATRRNIVTWGLYAAAIGPALKVIGRIGTTVTGAIGTIGKLSQRIGEAGAAFKATGSAATALTTLLGSGGMLVAGVAAATAAIAALIIHFKKLEDAKPDLSIDKSEIDSYKIDAQSLEADIDVDTNVTVSGDILSLKEKFIGILNDGLPETQEIREGMQADVDKAVQEVYNLIDKSLAAQKSSLDEQFAAGLIDEGTYNKAIAKLTGQADALRGDLTGKAEAVTAYVTALCNNNRAMTDEEIATLNALLESLGETADKVQQVTAAQTDYYKLAYEKTRLGYGDESDQQKALEYVEILADRKIQQIETDKKALEAVYAATTEGASDEEKDAQFQKLQEQTDALNAEADAIERARAAAHGGIDLGILEKGGISLDDLQRYIALSEMLKKKNIDISDGLSWNEKLAASLGGDYLQDAIDEIDAINKKLDESGLLGEDSPLKSSLATLTESGVVSEDDLTNTYGLVEALAQLVTQTEPAAEAMKQLETDTSESAQNILPGAAQAVTDTESQLTDAMQGAADAAKGVFPDTFDMHSPSRIMYAQGLNVMAGFRNGIMAGRSGVIAAMRNAARAAVNAAKQELDIHSPSRVFENEIGAMAMKGFGKGFTDEAKKQAAAIKSASRYLTSEAKGGAMGGSNNRTYNSESNVTVTGNTFIVNDKQDVQALANEIAALTRQQQRGRGLRTA
nr:MAG TPA: minor tail protein [Caudoviricetes sp.]